MFSNKIFAALLCIASMCFICSIWIFPSMQHAKLYNLPPITSPNDKVVILLCMLGGSGGAERCTLAQHKEFIRAGIKSILACKEKSFLANECSKQQLPYTTCSSFKIDACSFVFMPGVQTTLQALVKIYQDRIQAIHCSYRREIFIAKKVRGNLAIPTILTQHTARGLSKDIRETADGIVGVNKNMANLSIQLNKKDGITHSQVIAVPPFFDDSRIQSFKPTEQTRNDFFKENFDIKLQNCPLLLKIAHMCPDIEAKNHPLLFQAMHELIYKRNTPVQVALAGSGPRLDLYKKMAQDLNLSDYVHFLGNTDLIPALLYYADINILASSGDAFPLVLLEGGFMEKPTIIARDGCGAADWLIIDKETGFLFENKNAQDLADTIAYVLAHSEEALACGQRLHEKVVAEFLPDKTAQVLLNFYEQLKAKLLNSKN